jgi:hypothetical protein
MSVELINVAIPREAHELLKKLAEEDERSLAREVSFLIKKERERRD